MPFTHFLCESTGEPVAALDCLACARKGALPGCQMTAPVVRGILNGIRPPDFGVTVTTLLGCTRKARLKDTYDYGEKPSSLWWAYRGQLMHGIAASLAAEDPNVLAETRLSWLIEMPDGREIEISGQPDLVYTDSGHLMDYKTTKAVPKAWRITPARTPAQSSVRGNDGATRTKWEVTVSDWKLLDKPPAAAEEGATEDIPE